MIPLRSMLFTPGNNMRMISKAGALGADAIILDLEDSVPLSDKETARLFVRDSLQEVASHGSRVFVRINAKSTGLAEEDIEWIVQPGLSGIMLPKSESGEDVLFLSGELDAEERDRGIKAGSLMIVPLLETAKGVMNAQDVAKASPRIVALAFGGLDFSRDMGINMTKEGTELSYPRAHIAVVARAMQVAAIDTPCIEVRDSGQLVAESKAAKQFGFRGKLLIHPSQVGPVNEVFSPSESEVAYSRKVVEAFEKAQSQGLGAISLDGKMIDIANYSQAKDCLVLSAAISKNA